MMRKQVLDISYRSGLGRYPEGIDLSRTTIILPLNKAGFGYEEIADMLLDIKPETILFLSKLKKIRIEIDTGDSPDNFQRRI